MATNEGPEPEYVDISKINVGQGEGYEKKCIFCKVVNNEMGTEILHVDEEVSCFRDIKPGAPHHYLVVPTRHVGNLEKMVEIGMEILQKNNVLDLSDVRFGFHWPPFCSVSHLHLHVLAPASQMGFMSRLFYRPNSYWFVTADQLIQQLNS
ncbi:adenosine 5'-monophosphoramidase HINT3 isoform X3 [Salvelinus sp. IW2-2015]|uniref:adenosine 5'-monophosphoramidase HINT3 isoform X3 n=1 Tax=Salvelinus sp. IW2-2015 TaxID=2691554 RepID=UPI000CDF7F8F|nr:histidine triad nucleotide-binding protein 3 isoform X3 [Salvelinus alpinus]